ncbi:MAG: FtsW/RodA/SpoVE family cell cycle protein [Anaerolineae bacterium]|nr:FtsW/RodA/SpoVE family cell cycle protein [Anaerolineae bacterium]
MRTQAAKWLQFDAQMLVAVSGLLAVGLLAVHSAMYMHTSWFVKQVVCIAAGAVAMLVMARIPYRFWHRRSLGLMVLALASLAAVLFLGQRLHGASRQFVVAGVSVQPSEFAKLAVVIYVADWLSSRGKQIRQINYGLIPFSVILGVVAGLILREPDLSTTLVVVATAGTMFFVAGAELLQIVIAAGLGGLSLRVVVSRLDYAASRFQEFQEVWRNPLGPATDQSHMNLYALRYGGPLGVGLGKGLYKLYLALAHSDQVLAVVGEELGLLGTLTVLLLVAWLAYRGFRIAFHAPDSMGMLLAAGCTIWLSIQAVVHFGVVTALLPATGMTLPFVSAGGSSMVASMAAVGLLTSVWRACVEEGTLDAPRRLGWWNRRARVSSAGSR